MTDPANNLARFVADLQWQQVPERVVHEAKRSLVNHAATLLAGCRDDTILRMAGVRLSAAGAGEATVVGQARRADRATAAGLNAASANVHDFDDTHVGTVIHPTAPVAPVVFAMAECAPVSGRDALLALIAGIEVECRLGNAVSPWHYAHGWHITSTCGVFGAAAAAARLIALDGRRIVDAFGCSLASAGGAIGTLGTMAKSIGVGLAASNGLNAAQYAAAGMQGPTDPFAGRGGFLAVLGHEARADALDEGLGIRWEILRNTYKPYPCGVVLNPVIDACLVLHRRLGLPLADIERVQITANPLLRLRTDRAAPANGREAQVSAQHAVAIVLATGRAGLAEFGDAAVSDESRRAFAGRVGFVETDDLSIDQTQVTLTASDGRVHEVTIEHATGGLAQPLSDAALDAKLSIAAAAFGHDPTPLIDTLWRLDELADAGQVIRQIARIAQPESRSC